jgi:hypothetical protein
MMLAFPGPDQSCGGVTGPGCDGRWIQDTSSALSRALPTQLTEPAIPASSSASGNASDEYCANSSGRRTPGWAARWLVPGRRGPHRRAGSSRCASPRSGGGTGLRRRPGDEAGPGGDVLDAGDPAAIGRRCGEVAIEQVAGVGRELGRPGGAPGLAAHRTGHPRRRASAAQRCSGPPACPAAATGVRPLQRRRRRTRPGGLAGSRCAAARRGPPGSMHQRPTSRPADWARFKRAGPGFALGPWLGLSPAGPSLLEGEVRLGDQSHDGGEGLDGCGHGGDLVGDVSGGQPVAGLLQ